MKKSLLTLSPLLALLLTAAASAPKFVLKGSDLPASLNGQYIYLAQSDDQIDSVRIQDGYFVFSSDASDVTNLYQLFTKDGQIKLAVIMEEGDFSLTKDKSDKYRISGYEGNPTSLNGALAQYSMDMESALRPIALQYKETFGKLRQENLSKEESTRLENEMDALMEKMTETIKKVSTTCYESNKDNAVGLIAFAQIPFESDEDFVAAYQDASTCIKSNKQLKEKYEALTQALESGVGKPYKGDYVIEDGEGTSAKLSDYMQEGKYLLVDFWASWCGPCRQAMPHLAGIAKDHANTITVLSVGVWEKEKAHNDKAREELGITWNAIYDKDSKSVDEYGILGIPTLLLVNPEGTIVYRGHDPEAVDAKIKELGL